jgi:hypothetical protein
MDLQQIGMFLVIVGSAGAGGLYGQSSEAPGEDKPAEDAFHNIQVFRGMPQSQLLPVMHFMRASLGVRCDYCHIAENGMYYKDDKTAKATARQMIRMVEDINRQYGGRPVVTCNTCHRGSPLPVGVPSVTQAAFDNTLRAPAASTVQLPSIETILQKYEIAIGGFDAIGNLRSRFIRQSVCRAPFVDPQQIPVALEIHEKGPGKIVVITHSAEQTIRAGFDGAAAWMTVNGKETQIPASTAARLRSLLTIFPLGRMRDQYRSLKITGQEKLESGIAAYVVEGVAQDGKLHRLFFDARDGLLVRRIAYTQTMLGEDPEQVDLAEYWDSGGVKIPHRVTTSHLDNNHLNTVALVTGIENNVVIDDSEFAPPSGGHF